MNIQRLVVFLGVLAMGCEGLTLGENTAGQDTFLGFGAIAVDDVTEEVFVLRSIRPEGDKEREQQWLVRIDPDRKVAENIINLTGATDVRILFPASGILIMAEEDGQERLIKFERDTWKRLADADVPVRYHGTRMSSSRRYVAAADNSAQGTAPIHIIDTETLKTYEVAHGQPWLEAMWANTKDVLYVMAGGLTAEQAGDMHLLAFSLPTLLEGGFDTDADGFWTRRDFHLTVPNAHAGLGASFSWVGVAPDDSRVAFPLVEASGFSVAVVDTVERTLELLADARGPVGFTPDGSTLVSFRHTADGEGRELLLFAVGSTTPEVHAMPHQGGISYFITANDNLVLVTPVFGQDGPLILLDTDTKEQTTLSGANLTLTQFVSRPEAHELWAIQDGLLRVDLEAAAVEKVTLDFKPTRINRLPKRDRVVLGRQSGDIVTFFNPTDRGTADVPLGE